MQRIESINAARVAWCCADQGITPEQLAAECGIPTATIGRLMEGDGTLTFNQLRNVAEYFGRGLLFFLEPDPVVPEQVHTGQFRTLANQKPELSPKIKALIERVERHRDFYVALLEDLDRNEHPRYEPPDVAGMDVAGAAAIARRWLGLGHDNSFDTYRRAVEAQGILVFRSNGYNGKWQIAKESPILGFSLFDGTCPVIVIKKLRWDSQQAFTLMHELGHILMQRASSIDDEGDFQSHEGSEQVANAFAGHLLVPDVFLNAVRDGERPREVSLFDDWLEDQRRSWGVSTEVILRRLLDAGRLSQQMYTAYRTWRSAIRSDDGDEGGNRNYRHREPRHIFGDTYVRTVLSSLYARNITLSKASTYLDTLKVRDLHRLQDFYAGL